jgi:hypothetical protein
MKPTPDEIARLREYTELRLRISKVLPRPSTEGGRLADARRDEAYRTTLAALDALAAAEREVEALHIQLRVQEPMVNAVLDEVFDSAELERLRAELAELRDLQRAAIAYISNTGACELSGDDGGLCDGAGCDYCDLARVVQRVSDNLRALDAARAKGGSDVE